MIYLDNAATSLPKPDQVSAAVVHALNSLGNCSRGAHACSLEASRSVYGARRRVAQLFNCPSPDHVVFTANVTQALNTAISGLLVAGDHVITTVMEHNSVLRPLYRLHDELGVDLDFVGTDERGCLDYEAFAPLVRSNTRAIVCTHASNLTGNVVDIARVAEVARQHGLLLIVDGAQSGGAFPVDMQALGIDVFCFTGHKGLLGPQGTGGLCVRPDFNLEPGGKRQVWGRRWRPLVVGGTGVQSASRTQPEQWPTLLEAGTLNVHGLLGLSAAIDFLLQVGLEEVARRERELTQRFLEGARALPKVKLYGDFAGEHTAIVSLNLGDWDSAQLCDVLAEEFGIATRAGAHCAPLMHEALGTSEQGAVRFSFSYLTQDSDIDVALAALREIATW